MSKHTPGEWTVHPIWNNNPCIENGGVFEVEEAHYDVKERLEEGCDVERVIAANARLIAAAPELLEACQSSLSDLLGHGLGFTPLAEQLRAAIAKATGAAP